MFQKKFSKRQFYSVFLSVAFIAGCNPGTTSNTGYVCNALTGAASTPTAKNQTPLVTGCGYYNEPCVTVTICVPGTMTCQTIPNVLLDTGSVGLRLFSCSVNLPLTTETDSFGNAIGDFVGYLDGSCDWGPVKVADIYLGENSFTNSTFSGTPEYAPSVPLQIIDATFVTVPPTADHPSISCTSPDFSPMETGFNGILGVGLNQTDCYLGDAANCATTQGNYTYYSCTTSSCNPTTVPAPGPSPGVNSPVQVTNPVTLMNQGDNNGEILTFPSMTNSYGATTLVGSLTLGIATHTGTNGYVSNSLGSATVLKSDTNNEFQTNGFSGFDSESYPDAIGFIDSGSNTLAFPTGKNTSFINSLPICSDNADFYCPPGTGVVGFTATQADYTGATSSATINVSIANADYLLSTSNPNFVFYDIGSTTGGQYYFDWGFPFFIGRSVYVHPGGTTAAGGTAASFWAW